MTTDTNLRHRLVSWPQFDNSGRFRVWSDGDGNYLIKNETGHTFISTIAADFAAMKCKELNKLTEAELVND